MIGVAVFGPEEATSCLAKLLPVETNTSGLTETANTAS